MNTNGKSPRYVLVNGQEVYLSTEQKRVWDQMINKVRSDARRDKSCNQPNYHLCFGDCGKCPFQVQGLSISIDSDDYMDGFAAGEYSPAYQAPSPEAITEDRDSCDRIYAKAAELYRNGDRILYLKTVEGRSTYEIAAELDMPQTTVNKYFNNLLSYLREHRKEFI